MFLPQKNTPGNSTWFFLDHPWKFLFSFDDWPLEIPLSSITLPCLDFFWNSTFEQQKKVFLSSYTANSVMCDPVIQNEINMVSLRWPLSRVILETESSVHKIQGRYPNLTSLYVHSLFTIVLIKQIFEKNKSLKAVSGSRTQFWPKITTDSMYLMNWCRMSHTPFYCSTKELIVMSLICIIFSYIFFIL